MADGPRTLTAAGPTPADTPMLPAMPLLVPPDFPDTAVSSAMCLWAEDVDNSVDIARQADLYVHANFCVRAQPASLSALACPSRFKSSCSLQPEQSLVKHRSNYRVAQTHSQTALRQTAPPCQPHQQQRLLQPQVKYQCSMYSAAAAWLVCVLS